MEIRYLGHASLELICEGKHIIVDPFISGNPLAKHIEVNTLKADYILVTHAHQDHILDVENIATRTQAQIISNYEIAMYYEQKGFSVIPLNHGGNLTTDFGFLKYVNAVHTSSFPDGTYGGEPGGFVAKSKQGKTVYIAGDTALHFDMKLLPLQFEIDLAILPIGDHFTMGIEDAIHASDFVECSKVLGVHYNTFPPIKIDKNQAIESFSRAQKELILLEIGGVMGV